MEFISASQTTAGGASGHFDFSFVPINFGIMILEPGMSEQQLLFAETGDSKRSSFRMIFVMEDQVNYFGDGTGFIRSAVYIIHGDRLF